jgi:outer membrane protein insertion porin family
MSYRNVRTRVVVVLACLLLSSAGFDSVVDSAVAQDGTLSVSGIEVVGNRRVDANAIKAQLSGGSGRVKTETINEDVKNLYNSGFFDQVTVSAITQPGAGTVLRYTVAEKPVVRKIFIKGNDDISESDLSDVLKIEGRRFVDKSKLQALIRKAVSYYQGHGFYDATLEGTMRLTSHSWSPRESVTECVRLISKVSTISTPMICARTCRLRRISGGAPGCSVPAESTKR